MNGRMYRAVKILVDEIFADGEETEEVIWQGSDISALSKKHPPSQVWGADSLGLHEIEGGYIRWWYRFECQNEEGSWAECEDPRHPVDDPKHRELERAIDEENRRLFPGDYEDEYDDLYADDDDGYYDDEWFD